MYYDSAFTRIICDWRILSDILLQIGRLQLFPYGDKKFCILKRKNQAQRNVAKLLKLAKCNLR